MFRRYLQQAADVILAHLIKEGWIRVRHDIVKPHTGTDEYFFHLIQFAHSAQNIQIFFVIHNQVRANLREQALPLFAGTHLQLLLAGHIAEVAGGAAHIVNIAFEIRQRSHQPCFFHDRFFAAVLNNPPLMEVDSTEGAAAKTTAMVGNAELYLPQSRNPACFLIARMIGALERQFIQLVHFLLAQRFGWRQLNQIAVTVGLH